MELPPIRPSSTRDLRLDEYVDLLRHLIREPSVVGSEFSFYRVIRRELEEIGVPVCHHKGLLVAQGKEPSSLYLSAHVDRNGLLCTGPNEFQYAAFIAGNRGELFGDSVSEQMMDLIQDRFRGQRVQAHQPHVGSYLGQASITNAYVCPKRKNLIFELDGLHELEPGTPISFLDRLQVQDGMLSAQLDNVVSVAILIHLVRLGFQGTVLFSAEEEAGRSWRYVLEWFRMHGIVTDRLIVLDTSPYPTPLDALRQRLVLRRRDAGANFAPEITELLDETCQALGIVASYKDDYVTQQNQNREKPISYGRTELGRLITATDGEITGTTLQIPTTGYHTANETASIESISAALKVLVQLVP